MIEHIRIGLRSFGLMCVSICYINYSRKLLKVFISTTNGIRTKEVNTVSEIVSVWPVIRYISSTGQYRCTVSGLSLIYIYIYIILK